LYIHHKNTYKRHLQRYNNSYIKTKFLGINFILITRYRLPEPLMSAYLAPGLHAK